MFGTLIAIYLSFWGRKSKRKAMRKTIKYAIFLVIALSVLGFGCQNLMVGNVKSSDLMGAPDFINPFVAQDTDLDGEMVKGTEICGTNESGPDLDSPQRYLFEAISITSFTVLF